MVSRRNLLKTTFIAPSFVTTGCLFDSSDPFDMVLISDLGEEINGIQVNMYRDGDDEYSETFSLNSNDSLEVRDVIPAGQYEVEVNYDGYTDSDYISTNSCDDPRFYITIRGERRITIESREC